jgi:hypothetical protein
MRRLVPLALIGLFASCGTDTTTAGGGGFGGETVSGVVVGVSGRGIAGASVRVRPSGSLEGAASSEGSTDAAGRFRIEMPEGNAFRLEVAGTEGTDSVRALVDLEHGQSPGRILAQAPRPRRVRLRDASGNPLQASLRTYGLGRSVQTDDSGFMDLSALPAADLWMRATLTGGASHDLFVPLDRNEIVWEAGWLVDDFEGGRSQTRLASLLGGGWWYVAAQAVDSQTSRDIASMRDTLDAHGGRTSLRAGFSFSTSAPRFGLVGFHFGPTEQSLVDLSGFDSLVFWAKGRGKMRVELVADTVGGVTSHAVVLPLDSVWTRHAVASGALAPIDAGRRWDLDRKRVRFLQFIVFETAEFRVDDLRYFGRALP